MPQPNAILPWKGPKYTVIPTSATEPALIVENYAVMLRDVDKRAVAHAFQNGDYGMGAGHLWRKSMSRLRQKLAELGMQFLGEMLNREDISENSSPEIVLTEHDTISLAEALGYVDATGAMRLRQGFDLVSHFDSEQATEEMSITEAVQVVRGCVQYIFGSEESLTAIDFSNFRERLSSETIPAEDVSIEQLLESPLFFLRTALRVLLAAAKIEKAARLEHSLANLNTFLPGMWLRLTDDDRNSVGTTFAELSNVGTRPTATAGVRKALLKVKGFDYVPENLRSNSFKRAAQAVLSAHFGYNNFYNEPEPTRQLAAMGSSIPGPALPECIRAYFCVYLGNSYGVCNAAVPVAEKELQAVSRERWDQYFSRVFSGEENLFRKLTDQTIAKRWITLGRLLKFETVNGSSGAVKKLLTATEKGAIIEVQRQATVLLEQFRGK